MHTEFDKYLVIGNPIAHSKSPLIHAEFAKQTHQMMQYDRLLVAMGQFAQAVDEFRNQGGKGANVTVPFKLDALHYATRASERAHIAGAANTLKFEADGTCIADNTDGVGFIRDLIDNLSLEITHKKILLVGAGGAVRGILAPLLAQDPARLVIANRTLSRAQMLAKEFVAYGKIIPVDFGSAELKTESFDLIINGTSASLQGEMPILPASIFCQNTACYDLAYSDKPTLFLQWAISLGCQRYADGLGMLVEQAAESFYFWRGIRPDTKPVITQLRAV